MNYILDPMLFAFDVEATKEELESYLMEMQVLGDWWNDHRDEMYVLSDMAYELGDFYKIKLNESGVEIGILKGDPTVFFCERTPLKNEKDFIDFNDIINYNKSHNKCKIS